MATFHKLLSSLENVSGHSYFTHIHSKCVHLFFADWMYKNLKSKLKI